MTRPLRLLTLLLTCFVVAPLVRADDTSSPTPVTANGAPAAAELTRAERYAQAGVKTIAGPTKIALGSVAEFELKEGQLFIGPDGLDRFFELTQNRRNGNEVGVVVADTYSLFFDYDDVGYVKDDEKDKLDAPKMLKTMQENQERGNAARKERGWDEIRIAGWAQAPHYDEKTHNLTWALKLSSSADQFQSTWINESIRLLGRGGLMNVTMVCDNDLYTQATQAAAHQLRGDFAYVSGQRYEEWKSGDKIAEYGLTALVLGGGAIAAAKMGLFAQLGTFLAKMGKGIILVIVGIGAAIAKFFRSLVGAKPKQDGSS